MAATFSDQDIDRLLSAAEASLAEKASNQALAVKTKQQSLVGPAKASTSAPAADGKAGKEKPEKKEELTLRVPQLKTKDKKAVPDNAGAAWNHMPRTRIEDPNVKREFQLLRLRGVLDAKKHFKKDTRKDPYPQFSQMGTLLEAPLDYHTGRVPRRERKRTLVEEVLAIGDTNDKFKNRYEKIQEKKTSGKKAHYKKVVARRKRG
ncbi:rRNA-processing protein fcf2 [Cytospora mali]|uniref:rRNA-processing protein fcf2 n=1 Tax=Cytospora mali TaxID=578113 RepID=A0A194V612_CYTMA|nr:rRNA-processing protein fcf2 [Valsa mali var. pyri (nom. inval.)]